jgi:hypothetical protein
MKNFPCKPALSRYNSVRYGKIHYNQADFNPFAGSFAAAPLGAYTLSSQLNNRFFQFKVEFLRFLWQNCPLKVFTDKRLEIL